MKKNSLFLFGAMLVTVSFSSCGIFGKGCGCPEFGKIKQRTAPAVIASNKATYTKAG
jgi:hypothetical protein